MILDKVREDKRDFLEHKKRISEEEMTRLAIESPAECHIEMVMHLCADGLQL